MVGMNPFIGRVKKLQRLRSCLRNSALETVRALDVTDENFAVAIELLSKKFSNRRRMREEASRWYAWAQLSRLPD